MKYIYICVINLLTFFIFGIDKYKSKKNYYRISEKSLFFLCFIGGGIGGFIGMYIFRHKTKKWYFNFLVPVSVILGFYGWYYFYKALIKN